MNNNLYDILKWIAQIFLPALGTLYFGLSRIWGLPYGEEIVGTITVIDAFLGGLLGISSANYYKEQEQLKQDEMEEDEIEIIEGDDEDDIN